ncbi:VapC toxin family PIN domain ribonuclease [Melaminivora suipulveris]|uniref:Ribonuclease VapC n=1 Tax=Melaminivora suipulveris TaxID=2109913 RepID=A0A2R3Q959_9BURK|nr:type II toxin-antitoxin system VapC family toxin [Melaminivora suipulveris]AVO48299.1 VapC toxin family PIN domain ribonuclease [Melaminivora suipulveris]
MRWLLDTCTLSEPVRARPDAGVMRWLEQHADAAAISSASFGEIHYGLASLAPSARRNQLQAWALALGQQFEGRTLPADEAVWRQWGGLKASLRVIGRMQDALDLVVAATALHHGLTLVTRNTRHFQDTGVRLVNPWGGDSAS